MTTKPLVSATDGSEESLRAVEWAAREAVLHGAPLRIVAAAERTSLRGRPTWPPWQTSRARTATAP